MINQIWHTEESIQSDGDGNLVFKGYYGNVSIPSESFTTYFNAEKGGSTTFNVTI
ncbi:MAG: hypothetical protein ACOC44_16385 [Promethearchaeia archaeon]